MIVLWVAFGLVSLTLYFAQTASLELRTASHRSGAIAADQAILGAVRYLTNLLTDLEIPGQLPDPLSYAHTAVPVGQATFWILGRPHSDDDPRRPVFEITDENARLNLNTATADMLALLPRMTPELAAAIVDWRDSDNEPSSGGAEDETYLRLDPARRAKNAPFESIEELRLVYDMNLELLFGEDTNLNGVLDPNEDDGDRSPPNDNNDGRLDAGLLEYLTVHTRVPTTRADGTARLDLAASTFQANTLGSLLQERFGDSRGNQILQNLGNTTAGFTSVLEFFIRGQLTLEEAATVETDLVVSTAPAVVNVNTAPEIVLACLPGIGTELAPTLVAHRLSVASATPTVAWVTEVLDAQQALLAGPHLTGQSHQVTLDIAAVGPHGRGYRRTRFVCDLANGVPHLIHRRDLTAYGWALGAEVHEDLRLARSSP
jgi:type II secretory pathway component PulK